jgi:hypothetical protein
MAVPPAVKDPSMRVLLTALVTLASVTVQTQTVNYKRGDVVRLQPSSSHAVYRVVAVAGDSVRITASGIYVSQHAMNARWYGNEVPVTGLSSDFMEALSQANSSPPNESHGLIGDGYYFIVGDGRVNASPNYWGAVPAERIFEKVKAP